MSPNKILEILDLALEARRQNKVFNPVFIGEAGLGKSFICQQWVTEQRKNDPDFGFLDLRIAYLEAPDLVGFPKEQTDEDGRTRLDYSLPIMWPTKGQGLILLEEVNRGKQSEMNCLMQILTDRKVHNYKIPDGWVIASCINPDNGNNDVNTMDSALKNRFAPYEIAFDFKTFLDYTKKAKFHPNVINFLMSNMWTYIKPDQVKANGTYISPRTWEQVSTAEYAIEGLKAGSELHYTTITGILGHDIGKAYYSFIHDQSPVLAKDLKENKEKALEKLKTQVSRESYKGDLISSTVNSIIDATPDFPFETIIDVMKIIPADQAVMLIEQHCYKHPEEEYNLTLLRQKYPEIDPIIKAGLVRSKQKEIEEEKEKKTKKK